MSHMIRMYRGLEIHPLVYPHQPRGADGTRHYDEGFDASVRISRRGRGETETTSRVFRVPGTTPFIGSGEARLACNSHAEQLIDGKIAGQSVAGL